MKRLYAISILFVSYVTQSSTELVGSEMLLRGSIVKPPCTINGGENIEVDFGYVGVNRVEGDNYAKMISLYYICEGVSIDKTLKYLGLATDFNRSAVQSNFKDFGVQLQHLDNGVPRPFEVGSMLEIPANRGSSKFIVTPVKKAGSIIPEGQFMASATFQLEYP